MSRWFPEDFFYSKHVDPLSGSDVLAVLPIFGTRNESFDGRLRVSPAAVVDDTTFVYDKAPFRMQTSGTMGGYATHVPTGSLVRLVVNDTGSFAGMRGHKKIHYVIGQTIEWTAVVGVNGTPNTAQFGLFDDKQGFFFEKSGSDFNVVKRSSASGQTVETRITQSAWTVDPIDGTGVSEHDFDPSHYNIYSMVYQCHGTGRVTFFVNERLATVIDARGSSIESVIGSGDIVPCFEIRGPGSASLDVLGTATRVDGLPPHETWSARTFADFASASITPVDKHMLSIRPKSASINGIQNDSLVFPLDIEVMALDPILVSVYMGTVPPSGSGRNWKDVNANSLVEKFSTSSFDPSGSRLFMRTLGGSEETIHLHEDVGKIFRINREALVVRPYGGGQEVLSVVVRKITPGGSTTCWVVIRWDEIV